MKIKYDPDKECREMLKQVAQFQVQISDLSAFFDHLCAEESNI